MSNPQHHSNPLAALFSIQADSGILELFRRNLADVTDRAAATVLPDVARSLLSKPTDAVINQLPEIAPAIIFEAVEVEKPEKSTNGAHPEPVAALEKSAPILLPPHAPVKNDTPFYVLLRTNSIRDFDHLKAECKRPIYLRMEPNEFQKLRNYIQEQHPEVNLANLHRQTRAVRHFAQPLVEKARPIPTIKEGRAVTERKKNLRANDVERRHIGTNDTAPIPLPPSGTAVAIQPMARQELTPVQQAMQLQIPRMRRYARALTKDAVAADDLVQDALQRASAKIHLFKEGTDLRAWLFTIMHNQHVNQVRKAVREGQSVPVEAADSITAGTQSQMDKMQMRDLANCLARLPKEQREIILYIGLEGERYEDAAAHFGILIGTVRSRLSRGRELLRRLMEGDTEHGMPSDKSTRQNIHNQLLLLTART